MLLLTGCEPKGPKALLEGEKLVAQERYNEAIRTLQIATENLPREARAWNLLGLAYHGGGMETEAAQAYGKALALDHKLSAARFNLGSLMLEENQPQQAVSELTAFTLLQPRAVDGWLKLASAHYRLNHLEAAEAAYRTALSLVPRHPEALNGLGCIQVGRRRYVDAVQYFQAALIESPGYPQPLLNQAIVTHRYLNQKSTALQKYRQYLALQPRPENWDIAYQAAQGLSDEITGATRSPLLAGITNIVTRTPPPSAAAIPLTPRAPAVAAAATNGTTPPAPTNASTRPPVLSTARDPRTPPATSSPGPTVPAPAPAPLPVPPPVTATPPPPAATREPEPPPPALTVAEVDTTLKISPPQEITPPPLPPKAVAPPSAEPIPRATSPTIVSSQGNGEKGVDRPGFFQRLNPFRSKPRNDPPPPPPAMVSAPAAPRASIPPAPEPVLQTGDFKRYSYRQYERPPSGDRVKAAELVNKGILAHRERRPDEEIACYRSATLTDPACYDAFFNLGLAYAEQGDWQASLESYERALSIDPDSSRSRYNFAQALRQADYPVEAARELETILKGHPNDTLTMLALGNLYAQKFKQTRTARQYYLRLLEIDPENPKASEIRFWLAANP